MAQPQAPQSPKHNKGQDADVHSGHDQDVIRARALKIGPRVAVDKGFLADNHRVNQGCLPLRPEFMHLCDDAAMDPASPQGHAVSGESRKGCDIFHVG